MFNALIVSLIRFLNRVSPYHISFMLRERKFSGKLLSLYYSVYPQRNSSYAIVMQGQVMVKDHFTFETLKLYRHIYPSAQIILSTWKGEYPEELSAIRELSIDIIDNEKPDFAGLQNINLQIASTKSGILQAQENGAVYILKTRTDIRLYKNIDFLQFLTSRAKEQPAYKDSRLENRLVAFNCNMFVERLYDITDLMMFGHARDMARYWNVPFDERRAIGPFPVPELYKSARGEFYFTQQFYKTMDFELSDTYQRQDQALRQFFSITDVEELDMFWYKYRYYMEGKSRYANLDSFEPGNSTWTYGKWLSLFDNT